MIGMLELTDDHYAPPMPRKTFNLKECLRGLCGDLPNGKEAWRDGMSDGIKRITERLKEDAAKGEACAFIGFDSRPQAEAARFELEFIGLPGKVDVEWGQHPVLTLVWGDRAPMITFVGMRSFSVSPEWEIAECKAK